MCYANTADHMRDLQRVASRAGHDHGWQHAESFREGQGGGLYADPVVPEQFSSVARWYVAAYADGVSAFLEINPAT